MNTRLPAEQRKEEIRQTALQLAFKVGPTQVTTGMIAAQLGLSQPAIYKHFPSKDDILIEIARHLGERITQNTDHAKASGTDPVTRLKNLVLVHLELVKQYPALPEFMIMRDTVGDHLALQGAIQTAMTRFHVAIETEVKAAIQIGQFRATLAPTDATTLIFGVIQSLILRMLVSRNPEILAADGARLIDLQLAGFSATGDNG